MGEFRFGILCVDVNMKGIDVTFAEAFLPRVAREVMGLAAAGAGKVLDVSAVVVIVPGRRGARRVVELLAEHAHAAGKFLIPPRVMTPQRFCAAIVEGCGLGDVATEYEVHAAWMRALAERPEVLARVMGRGSDGTAGEVGEAQLFSLAQALGGVYAALAGEQVCCADVAQTFAQGDAEYERWCGIGELTAAMRAELAQQGTRTNYDAVEEALKKVREDASRALPGVQQIIAAGVVDQFKQFRECLGACGERVTVMTYGPVGCEWFDEYGALRKDAAFGLLDEHGEAVVCCDSAAGQAHAVVEWLRGAGVGHAPTDVVIGVPDAEVIRPLCAALDAEGVVAHNAVGTLFGESSVGVLLGALGEVLEEGTWAAGLRLLRHPVVEGYLRRTLPGGPRGAAAYAEMVGAVEGYLAEHIVQRITRERPRAGDDRTEDVVGAVLEALLGLVEPLKGTAPLYEWIGRLNAVLERVYDVEGGELGCEDDEALRAWSALSAALQDARIKPEMPVTAAVAIREYVQMLNDAPLAPARTGPAIDLVGWLELALDDAPVVAVTGMNEGVLSESVTSDAFLPDGLRVRLGLPNNERRLQRDRYIMRTIVGTGKKVLLTAGRAANTGDPLRISRVLCDMTAAGQAALMLRFYPNEEARRAAAAAQESLPVRSGEPIVVAPPSDLNLTLAIRSLSATDFKHYLACRYRFYLRCTVGEAPPGPAHELDALQFGMLLHGVLEEFGRRGPAESEDTEEVRTWLWGALERMARRRYGAAPGLAVELQLWSCRQRLAVFAHKQVERVREGWRIVAAEEASGQELVVAGVPVKTRIDRIDRRGSEVQILDYKTGGAKDPQNAAYQHGAWVDLQLPLYWHAVKASGDYEGCTVATGYFNIPSSDHECEVRCAQWMEGDYANALAEAEKLVRAMTSGEPGAFVRTSDGNECARCAYRYVCQRV